MFCICPESDEQRAIAFEGFERDRGTLKYGCPAAAYVPDCAGCSACHHKGGC